MKHRPPLPGFMSALQVQPLIGALQDLGYDGERVLGLAGLTRQEISDPNARIPTGVEFALWDAAVEVTGDPLIGLRIAERVAVGALGAFEYLLRSSKSVRTAFDQADRFMKVIDELTRMAIFEEGEQARIRMWRDGGYPIPAHGTECVFLVIAGIGKKEFPSSPLREVCFSHKAHGDPAIYAQHFGCNVRFEAPHDELVIERALLDAPLSRADAGLAMVLEEHVQRLLQALPDEDPFVRRARGALLTALGEGNVSLDALATTLHMSPRTLRRRLTEHGVAYKTLLDEVRRELALQYVARNTESLDALSQRLGFTEPSTFYRAFKRWTGTTPAQYRSSKHPSE